MKQRNSPDSVTALALESDFIVHDDDSSESDSDDSSEEAKLRLAAAYVPKVRNKRVSK